MINDTPESPKVPEIKDPFAPERAEIQSKPGYDGGFHVKARAERDTSAASKRSSTQKFTFG